MRSFIYYVNLILTIITAIIIILSYLIENNGDGGIMALLILGFYQVLTATGLTIYLAVNHLKLFLGFAFYWLIVFLFFNIFFQYSISSSFLIALYHLYLCYSIKKNNNL
jgi:hypothetical protein